GIVLRYRNAIHVNSNCELFCCTANSRRKGKVPFFVTLFVKGVLHCTTRLTEQIWNILSSDNAKGIVLRYRNAIHVNSNCELFCCTANSRRKGKIPFVNPFAKAILHYTTRRRKQFERLRTRKKISLQHKAIKGYCPKNAFSKSTCK